MSFQRAMSSGLSLCCRATSAWLLRPERTSRTTSALNCGVKDRRRRFGMGGRSWEASLDYRTGPVPGAHFRALPKRPSILEPLLPIVHQILKDDRKAPRKQRHTAKRIFERLRDEHRFAGKLTVVK